MSDIARLIALSADPSLTPAGREMFRKEAAAALERAAPTPQPGQKGFAARALSQANQPKDA